jgi:hypothetical protein
MTYQQLSISEPSYENVGYYGIKWLEFMENHHPKLFNRLKKNQTLYTVARSVNKDAKDYKNLLDRQYEQLHPRPYEWEDMSEHRSWEFTRDFYTEHTVMVETVLLPYAKS